MLVAGVVEWAGVDEQVLEEGELQVKLPGASSCPPRRRGSRLKKRRKVQIMVPSKRTFKGTHLLHIVVT